jgi:hypothetical protein
VRLTFHVALICGASLTSSCVGGSDCSNEILDIVPNPRGAVSAVAFSRNCGATTGNNIQVSIVKNGVVPEGKGNVLILDKAPEYHYMVRPAWNSDGELILIIPPDARIFAKNTPVDNVRIKFSYGGLR